VALRRILSRVVVKKRASANSAERAAWQADDLLFVSTFGEGDERQISFAHFSHDPNKGDLPTLKVLGWDNLDTLLHLDDVATTLTERLAWPKDEDNIEQWRETWRSAFIVQHREVVTTSERLSIRLAELARAIRDRIRTALAIETETGPLTKLMKAFQEALVHDLDADGFSDMYAQTIAYGLLSARIADPKRKTADDFAAHMRTNPFLRELMATFLKVGGRHGKAGGPGIDFDELGVSEVVKLLDDANMEAVVRDFGDKNPQEDPVIHFYEHFLAAYDKEQKVSRGVFYTPRPVVSYIVRSVDELLRTEFCLEDGLADTATWGDVAKRHKDLKLPDRVSPEQDFIQILDPATGTGTFLVEAIDLIHKTLLAKWKARATASRRSSNSGTIMCRSTCCRAYTATSC
jgi:predicted helicase